MNESVAPVTAVPPERRRRWAGRIVQLSLVAATAVVIVLFRDRLPDFGAIWSAAGDAELRWLIVVVVAEALSMGAFARLQRLLLIGGGVRMSVRRAFAVTYAGNALSTTLPAGPAVSVVYSYKQFRRSGASAQLATMVILVGGIVTTTAYSLVALVALLISPHSRIFAAGALGGVLALAAGLGLLWIRGGGRARLAAAARGAAGRLERHPRLAPYAGQLRDGRRVLRLTRRAWAAIAVFALLNWLFDILALIAATRAVGIEISPYAIALAYFAAQAAGSLLPVLPGGLGAIESSMAGALVAMGAGLAPAGAAVGLYRLVSYWGVVAVGWLAWVMLRESGLRAPRPRLGAMRLPRPRLGALRPLKPGLTAMRAPRPGLGALRLPRPRLGGLRALKPGLIAMRAPRTGLGGLRVLRPGPAGPRRMRVPRPARPRLAAIGWELGRGLASAAGAFSYPAFPAPPAVPRAVPADARTSR